jgi:uncharacterized protein (DUF697 family)/GTP-binding protein EngB required for normal cell division
MHPIVNRHLSSGLRDQHLRLFVIKLRLNYIVTEKININSSLMLKYKKVILRGNCMETKFDLQHFDYQKAFDEVKAAIKKPNILVCGASQAGKSTLINDIFQMSFAETGDGSRPKTRGVKLYTSRNATVNFYDSEGYEVGDEKINSFESEVIEFIDKLKNDYKGDLEKQIHEVWFCIDASTSRFLDADRRFITAIKAKDIPIMILLTKVDDGISVEELEELKHEIRSFDESLDCYTYTIAFEDDKDAALCKQFKQQDEIINWAIEHLDDALKTGLIPALKGQLEIKKNLVLTRIIPKYTAKAILSVGVVAVTPASFSDSAILMGLQVKMTVAIMSAYGIDISLASVAADVVGSNLVSLLGKTLATKLIQFIPYVGKAIEVAVDVSVAGTITAILGAAIAEICAQYLKTCIRQDGSASIQFVDFFTSDILKETFSDIRKGKTDIKLQDIINSAIKDLPNQKPEK